MTRERIDHLTSRYLHKRIRKSKTKKEFLDTENLVVARFDNDLANVKTKDEMNVSYSLLKNNKVRYGEQNWGINYDLTIKELVEISKQSVLSQPELSTQIAQPIHSSFSPANASSSIASSVTLTNSYQSRFFIPIESFADPKKKFSVTQTPFEISPPNFSKLTITIDQKNEAQDFQTFSRNVNLMFSDDQNHQNVTKTSIEKSISKKRDIKQLSLNNSSENDNINLMTKKNKQF